MSFRHDAVEFCSCFQDVRVGVLQLWCFGERNQSYRSNGNNGDIGVMPRPALLTLFVVWWCSCSRLGFSLIVVELGLT